MQKLWPHQTNNSRRWP